MYMVISHKWISNLRVLEEVGTVSLIEDKTLKLKEKGITCIFVGYAENHSKNCYRIWCKKSNKYYLTRDIVFLHRMYYEKPQRRNEIATDSLKIIIIEDDCTDTESEVCTIDNENVLEAKEISNAAGNSNNEDNNTNEITEEEIENNNSINIEINHDENTKNNY